MQEEPKPGMESSLYSLGQEKSTVLANILKGYEDFTLDPSGKIISSNLEAVNVTGYEEWEVMGRNFSIFYSQEDKVASLPEDDLRKARIDGRLTFSAWRLKKRNVTFWAQVTLASIKDPDGHVNGYKMILKDQTHRLLSSQRVKRFRDEYLNVFNNPFIGIFKFKLSDFKFSLINSHAIKIIGRDEREIVRFNEIFINNQERQSFIDTLTREKRAGAFEFRVNRNDREVWARIDCQFFEQEGFAEGVITDITSSKMQLLELKRLNKELDKFIYHASHDLRSPLTTLLGLINLAELDAQNAVGRYTAMMRERVNYLDNLLGSLASVTHNNKTEVVTERIDLEEIISELLDEFNQSNSKIEVSITVSGSHEFYNDENRVRIILKSVIANAFKYYNPHVARPFLKIAVVANHARVFIRAEDNGRGIHDDHLHQIFDMFYTANSEISGTGLGLFIAKSVADKLNGKIRVKSKLGKGTQFEIELPNLKLTNKESLEFK